MLATALAWSLMCPFTMAALGAVLQVETPESSAATPIEQALMEHVCRVVPSGGAPEADRYLVCLRAQLLALRSDFGRDLGRLSGAERRALDSMCNEIRTESGRDAYLDCLGAQLTALRSRRSRGNPAPPPLMPAPPPAADGPAPGRPVPAAASARLSGLWIGAGVLVLLAVAGGAVLVLKTRRVLHKCRVCGSEVPAAGDLCPKCRHEAAEAVRRAASERAEQQRAQESEQRRQKEQAEAARVQKAQLEEEDARVLQLQQQREEEARKREDDERRRQEEESRSRIADVAQEDFDPYAVLEIPRDATPESIRGAYEQAKSKCDPAQVAHLGYEVQEHFAAKLQAVERAYKMLIDAPAG